MREFEVWPKRKIFHLHLFYLLEKFLHVGSWEAMDFRILKWIKFCALWKFLEKIKPVVAHSSLQLSVASTLYTSLLHQLAAALHACHTALRYFPPTKPYLPCLLRLLIFLLLQHVRQAEPSRCCCFCISLCFAVAATLLCCFIACLPLLLLLLLCCAAVPLLASRSAAALLLACYCRR
jgi:hypothetical protein